LRDVDDESILGFEEVSFTNKPTNN